MKSFADPAETAFNNMAALEVKPFIQRYVGAVRMGDVKWLESNVPGNPQLTEDNRRWLADFAFDNSPTGRFSIHAVETRNYPLLGFLLREGALPDRALPTALINRDSTAVKMVCDAGADANATYQSVPSLNIAAVLYDADSCGHLINAQAHINAFRSADPRCTALFDCISKYERDVQEALQTTIPDKLKEIPRRDALRTIGVLLEHNINPHQKGRDEDLSAYEVAESFAELDPRPLKLIQEWQHEAAAKAEVQKVLAKMRRGGPAAA